MAPPGERGPEPEQKRRNRGEEAAVLGVLFAVVLVLP
jgi:hypothetical protein